MTTTPMAGLPQTWLDEADQMLTNVVRGARGAWPRACAWLLRLALETAMDEYWLRVRPEVASMRARSPQFLILDQYAGRQLAAQAGYAWSALSRAGHHHCYELGLTAGELGRLRELVASVVTDLAVEPALQLNRELRSPNEGEEGRAHE